VRPAAIGLALGLLLAGVASAALPARGTAQAVMIEVPVHAQGGSGEMGFATLEAVGNQTKVTLHLSGLPAGADQPSHIHEGTCANLNPAPAFPLNNVRGPDTESTVDVSLQTLMSKPYAINLHQSAQQLPNYVACGDLSWSGTTS